MYRFSDWEFTHGDDRVGQYPWWMDVRHTLLLYHLASLGQFKNILEVGCYMGASTSAFLQALNEGQKERAAAVG